MILVEHTFLYSTNFHFVRTNIVTKDRRIDYEKKQTGRSVFLCRVFGPKGVGKVSVYCVIKVIVITVKSPKCVHAV